MEEQSVESVNFEFEKKVKQKNKRIIIYSLIRFIVVFILFISTAIFFFSPISSARNLSLKGSIYYTKDEIYKFLPISENTSLFTLNSEELEGLLKDDRNLIKNAKVKISPTLLEISLQENAPCARYEEKLYTTAGDIIDISIISKEDSLREEFYSRINQTLIDFTAQPTYQKYLAEFMEIVLRINLTNKCVEFVDYSFSEKTFVVYYKQVGNPYYFRVNLSYDSSVSLTTYSNNLVLNEKLLQAFNESIEKNNLSLHSTQGLSQNIEYYAFDTRIEKNQLIISAAKGE